MSVDSKDRKIWLITGANSGFGKRLVNEVLARGDRAIATGRSLDVLTDVFSEVHADVKERLRFLEMDVKEDFDVLKRKIDNAISHSWQKIDVVVNNAGAGFPALLEEGDSILRETMEINVFGVAKVTNCILPYFRAQKSGTVVTIGSRSAWNATRPGTSAYCASKAAIHCWTETLAAEVRPFNIKCLIVAPGAFRTEGIYSRTFTPEHPISDYNATRDMLRNVFAKLPGTQKGDPDKAMQILVDVVREEGKAKGKGWPESGYLVLGKDAEGDIRRMMDEMIRGIDEWKDVCWDVELDE